MTWLKKGIQQPNVSIDDTLHGATHSTCHYIITMMILILFQAPIACSKKLLVIFVHSFLTRILMICTTFLILQRGLDLTFSSLPTDIHWAACHNIRAMYFWHKNYLIFDYFFQMINATHFINSHNHMSAYPIA
ncbi:hypothetical protein ACJX0J_020103 [Zea mays]